MSWLLNLYETYEANLDCVGEIEKKYNDQEYTLLPISHTTQMAQIEVIITEDGEFYSAEVINKKDAETLVPCTKDAGGRVSTEAVPYPLHTKLYFAAGDFSIYGGKIEKEGFFFNYIENLKKWVESPYFNSKIKSVYTYLSKKRLIQDLVNAKVLGLDVNRSLIEKWDKRAELSIGDKPRIFSVISNGIENAFIRFNVYSPNKLLTQMWKDKEVSDSYIKYYNNQLKHRDLCFVTGIEELITDKHPTKIRNAGDKAKLISANDTSGFTFRGRFSKSNEVASIGYDVSQKAHNALKWLINRQGKVIDQRVFLVWQNKNVDAPDPMVDTFSLFPTILGKKELKSFTNQEFARELSKALDGYRSDLTIQDEVNILILDSATTGRLAVLYYRNMDKEIYLNRIVKWHSTCVWQQRYFKDKKLFLSWGAPSTKDIAFAAYGKASEKAVKGLMERILPCIIDDKSIPIDIVKSAINRASNPVSFKEGWEWEQALCITCALVNKREKEEYKLALDAENSDRSYLFGRLLAVADVLERRALGSDEGRSTNAIRYMNSFSQHPERTWKTIQASLQPYQARLGTKAMYLSALIDDIASRFIYEDFNNKALSGKYLLGFYSQRHELYEKKSAREVEEEK